MAKMATNGEVNSKIGSSLSPASKCPTKKVITDTGIANVSGTYSDTQLVDLANVSKLSTLYLSNFKVGTVYANSSYNSLAIDIVILDEFNNVIDNYQTNVNNTKNAVSYYPSSGNYTPGLIDKGIGKKFCIKINYLRAVQTSSGNSVDILSSSSFTAQLVANGSMKYNGSIPNNGTVINTGYIIEANKSINLVITRN